MKPSTARKPAGQAAGAGRPPLEACDLYAQLAELQARFETRVLPDDFMPGWSLTEALSRILQQYTNYNELAAELELTCVLRVSGGRECGFSEDLASGTDRLKCPARNLVLYALKKMADEKSEEALANWSRRPAKPESVRITLFPQSAFAS